MTKPSATHAQLVRRVAASIPFYRHLGMRLTKIGRGRAEMVMKVRKGLTQDQGVAHGGALASIIDSVVGLALHSTLTVGGSVTTVELKVNFIAPARPGLLRAEGKIIHKGRRIAVGEATIRNSKKKLIAKGLVTYMIL